MNRHIVELPSIRSLAVHAGRHVAEATVVPLGLFYALVTLCGLRWALVGALAWSYAALVRRLVRRERMPGILLLGALLLTVRTAISWVTGSLFIYFLQPTLGTFLVAALFLGSVTLRRPLAERLAHDFCPLPDSLVGNGRLRSFFHRISLLWALVYVVNGTATLLLLLSSSVGVFLLVKSIATTALFAAAIGLSYLWFRRSLRDEGVVIRWGRHRPAAAASA